MARNANMKGLLTEGATHAIRILLTFTFCCLAIGAAGQNIDSLKQVWRSGTSSQVEKYTALGKLSDVFSEIKYDTDSAIVFSELQLSLAREMGWAERELETLLYSSSLYYEASRYEEAQARLEKSLEICLNGNDPGKLPDIYRMYGIVREAQGNPSESHQYFTLSYQSSLENKDSVGLSKALNSLGISNQYYLGKYQQAIDYYTEAIAINKALGRTSGLGNNYYNLSTSYASLGNTVMAIANQLEALKHFERTHDTVGIQDAYNSIGNTYSLQRDPDKAMEYFEKSLNLSLRTKDKVSQALVLINIGNVYAESENFTLAGENLREGVLLLEQIGNSNYLDHGYLNLGKFYLKAGEPELARNYLEMAVTLSRNENDEGALASALTGLGEVAYESKQLSKTLDYLNEAIPYAKKLESKEALSGIYELMYRTYAAQGDISNELSSYRNFITYRDSLQDRQIIRETTKQEMEFQFSKKQLADSLAFAHRQTLNELRIRRGRGERNMAIIGMILLIGFSGLVYRQYRFTKKARTRSDELLLNILPYEIAQELKEKGKAEARDFDNVSILFTDFKEFTSHSSQMSASELVGEINHCFEAFDRIMEKYSIEKIKTIGDGYMAAGGLPKPTPDSAKNTIMAAIEMQDFIHKRAIEQRKINKIPFRMRLGIHTGPVMAGIVGFKKFQYDLWGDTVNTASRLESRGGIGKVNISQETYLMVRDEPIFTFEPRGQIQVKGKGKLEMFYVELRYAQKEGHGMQEQIKANGAPRAHQTKDRMTVEC
jgi:class 3 adenylate cyclase